MSSKFFEKVYETTNQGEVQSLYDDWADTYDRDVVENGYVTPARCAAALASVLDDRSAPIFDFACGTGLSGAALAEQAFTTIDGVDLSQAMLEIASRRGVYRALKRVDVDENPAPAPGEYAAIAAIGALSPGAAPAGFLDRLIDGLAAGALLVFSYNDHTLTEAEYTDRLAHHLDSGRIRILFEEHGDHIVKLGSKSTVYVAERL